MPLHIRLAINELDISHIKISRLEPLVESNRTYDYLVEAGDISTNFVHCYADGAEECARRALEALHIARERRESDSSR